MNAYPPSKMVMSLNTEKTASPQQSSLLPNQEAWEQNRVLYHLYWSSSLHNIQDKYFPDLQMECTWCRKNFCIMKGNSYTLVNTISSCMSNFSKPHRGEEQCKLLSGQGFFYKILNCFVFLVVLYLFCFECIVTFTIQLFFAIQYVNVPCTCTHQ